MAFSLNRQFPRATDDYGDASTSRPRRPIVNATRQRNERWARSMEAGRLPRSFVGACRNCGTAVRQLDARTGRGRQPVAVNYCAHCEDYYVRRFVSDGSRPRGGWRLAPVNLPIPHARSARLDVIPGTPVTEALRDAISATRAVVITSMLGFSCLGGCSLYFVRYDIFGCRCNARRVGDDGTGTCRWCCADCSVDTRSAATVTVTATQSTSTMRMTTTGVLEEQLRTSLYGTPISFDQSGNVVVAGPEFCLEVRVNEDTIVGIRCGCSLRADSTDLCLLRYNPARPPGQYLDLRDYMPGGLYSAALCGCTMTVQPCTCSCPECLGLRTVLCRLLDTNARTEWASVLETVSLGMSLPIETYARQRDWFYTRRVSVEGRVIPS
jgi:hypothetical protein